MPIIPISIAVIFFRVKPDKSYYIPSKLNNKQKILTFFETLGTSVMCPELFNNAYIIYAIKGTLRTLSQVLKGTPHSPSDIRVRAIPIRKGKLTTAKSLGTFRVRLPTFCQVCFFRFEFSHFFTIVLIKFFFY